MPKSSFSEFVRPVWIIAGLFLLACVHSRCQEPQYGVNDSAGKYAESGDARIYYEVYGEGRPVVLLHGGFAYIDQYRKYIPVLSKNHKVIAIASRGYGKSEIGARKFTYALFAEDVKAVLQKETQEKAIIIGFSDGAVTSYLVAAKYPEIVSKVVAMGGCLDKSGYTEEGFQWLKNFNSAEFASYRPDFKSIMPQPERWDELIENLRGLWSETNILAFDDLKNIECPVLLMAGDRDIYSRPEHMADIYRHLPDAQLAIVPNSKHIDVSPRNTMILEQYILKFIE